MQTRALPLFFLAAWPVLACKCPLPFSACREAASSNAVFVGRVESVAPQFLDAWNRTQTQSLRTLNEESDRARTEPTDKNLSALRDTYLKTFPDLPPETKTQLAAAKSHDDLVKSFYTIVGQGKLVHFKVKTLFRMGGDNDDDEPKAKAGTKDDDDQPGAFDVWTPFDDCGVDFQVGETYLVYADNDEETGVMSTGACTRTRRLTDAGEDLAYLYFLKDDEKRSSRMEGYVTSNEYFQREIDDAHEPQSVKDTIANVVVELRWGQNVRYVRPDANGRFVFDGLPEGAYALTAYGPGYPRNVDVLAGPKRAIVKETSCSREILFIPQPKK